MESAVFAPATATPPVSFFTTRLEAPIRCACALQVRALSHALKDLCVYPRGQRRVVKLRPLRPGNSMRLDHFRTPTRSMTSRLRNCRLAVAAVVVYAGGST